MCKLFCLAVILLILGGVVLCILAVMDDMPPAEERHYSFTNITPGPERGPCICGLVVVLGLAVWYVLFHADKIDKAKRM